MRFIDLPAVSRTQRRTLAQTYASGEIRSSDPKALARFEKAFQFRPATVLSSSDAINARLRPDDILSAEARMDVLLLEIVPACYSRDALPDWEAVLRFEIDRVGPYTLRISRGTCEATKGATDDTTAIVWVGVDAFAAFIRHQIYDAAARIASGADEDELFGPVREGDIVELKPQHIGQVAGGFDSGYNCLLDYVGCQMNFDNCTTNSCSSESCGGATCGANGCGGQAAGGGLCGALACGGNACTADVCAEDACGADACAGEACTTDACGAEACAGNACGLDLCGANACVLDSCVINVIPGVPGI